jgi:hypothetical protein
MEITSGEIFAYSIAAILIQYVIIRVAVSHGNNTSQTIRQLRMQTMLLAELAKKAGVSENEIDLIYSTKE